MHKQLDIDRLLQVYFDGIYAMDPKTALPFWDYDFAPLFGDLWAKKMIKAAKRAKEMGLSAQEITSYFENIAVLRKELIYSLFDLKVGDIPKDDRMFYVDFWWNVVTAMCQRDCLVERSNIVHTDHEIRHYLKNLPWQMADPMSARQVGNIAMNLNSIAYGLYTDIFAHNSMENFGAYDVSDCFGGEKHILVIKQWTNLKPVEIYPEFKTFPYRKLNIFAIYRDIEYTVDIYTHQIYSGSAATSLVQYCVVLDNKEILNELHQLKELNAYLGPLVADHFTKIKERGFEDAKRTWVLARNYQFKDFFAAIGMDWYDQEMLNRVKDRPIEKTDYWDFDKYQKEVLFAFWKDGFDPRLDTIYSHWDRLLREKVMASEVYHAS